MGMTHGDYYCMDDCFGNCMTPELSTSNAWDLLIKFVLQQGFDKVVRYRLSCLYSILMYNKL